MKKIHVFRTLAACLAVAVMIGLVSVAYAADLGGIQRKIQIWINGDQTDAVLEVRGNEYTVHVLDQDGISHEFGGGGVAIEDDGSERPLTEAEILEQLDSPDVQYRDDGTVWVCYHNGETEITDRFDADGVCYVQLKADDGILYLTVRYDDGFAYSPHSYPAPASFRTGKD